MLSRIVCAVLFFCTVTQNLQAFDGLTAFDRDAVEEYWNMRWRGGGDPSCAWMLATAKRILGIKPKPALVLSAGPRGQGKIVSQLLNEPHSIKSKSQTNRPENRGKLFQLQGRVRGMLINGKDFADFDLILLPKQKVPVAVLSPTVPAKGRIILLHGLGYSISTVFSMTSTAIALNNIALGGNGDPFATWFAETYPKLRVPYQIVLMDVPPMGWAPPLDKLPSASAMAEYLAGVIAELDLMQPLPNFFVSRSASGPLSLLAGRKQAGVVITGATFPHRRILEANRQEVLRLERDEGESPDWDIIDGLLARFNEKEFYRQLEEVAKSGLPVRAIVGGADAETPRDALWKWANLFGFGSDPFQRSQYVIQGAGHQVFRRPAGFSPTEFKNSDPDVMAFRALLEFLVHYTP